MNNNIQNVQIDSKVYYIENLIREIESTICDRDEYKNPDHMLSNDIRDYLIQRELGYLYRHLKR